MAWNTHPQGRKGDLYLWNPTAVFEAELDYLNTLANGKVSGEDIFQYLYVTSITTGALADLVDGMTLSLGSAPGLWDYGWCRVRGITNVSGTDVILVWIGGQSPHAGDLALGVGTDTRYLTAWEDIRLWAKPTYFDDNGTGWYDGNQSNGTGGTNYNHNPVANGGPPILADVDPATGVLTVERDASRSFRVEHTAVLGSWSSDLAPASTITSSSENGANIDDNVVDGDNGTYWQPSGALEQWIQFELAGDQRVYKISITSHTTYAPKDFMLHVMDAERGDSRGYTEVLDVRLETGWGAYETRSFYVDVDHNNEIWGTRDSTGHTTYRLYIYATNGSTLAITEIKLYAEERTGGATEAYTWDMADGTITVGTVNSEAPTVTFPAGKRVISLTVEDSNGYTSLHRIPIVALGVTPSASEVSFTSAAYSASNTAPASNASNAFNGNPVSCWFCDAGITEAWVQVQLAAADDVCRYGVQGDATYHPIAWQVLGSNDGTNFDVLDERAGEDWAFATMRYFTIAQTKIADYTYYRLLVTSFSGTYLRACEWNLYPVSSQETALSGVEIISRELDLNAGGQQLTAVLHEDISDYPDGTLVLYREREWFGDTEGEVSEAQYDLVDCQGLKFWGWIESEEPAHSTGDTGLLTSTRVTCFDIGRKLATLPGWNLVFERKYSPAYSFEMRHPSYDRLIWFAARYLSNASEIADFFWSGTGDWFGAGVVGMFGGDLLTMMDTVAQSYGHRLTCNRWGQLRVRRDQNLSEAALRDTMVHVALTESDYTDLAWTRSVNPHVHTLLSQGVETLWLDHDAGGFAVAPVFTMAPGQVPIQGVQEVSIGELVSSGVEIGPDFWRREANRFESRLAHRDRDLAFTLCGGNDIGLDPGLIAPSSIDLAAAYAAQRGQAFSDQKFYPVRVQIDYDNEGFYNTVSVEAELYLVSIYNYALEYEP